MPVKPLQEQPLEWIGRAPVHFEGRATSSASPEAVFAVLADHERWPEWFPNLKRVEITGAASGVGARRRVTIPGAVFEEVFIAWDPGERWAFTGTGCKPHIVRSLVEDCRLGTADGKTTISYSMYVEPGRGLGLLTRLLRRAMDANLSKAMAALARRAEQG